MRKTRRTTWKTVAKPTLVCTVLPGLTAYKDRPVAAAGFMAYKDRSMAAEEMTVSLYPGHWGYEAWGYEGADSALVS